MVKGESIDFFDNDTLDWIYKDNDKLVVVATDNIYGDNVSIHIRITRAEAARLSRILQRWAETGELREDK